MNWKSSKILRAIKRFFTRFDRNNKRMNNMRRRRESVASMYRKTTKFLSSNTSNLLKKMPNKYRVLAKMVDELERKSNDKSKINDTTDEENEDLGDRDLDYYLGVRKKENYWRDPVGKEQIRKDYLVYHCGITEEDYDQNYKKIVTKVSYVVQPRLKQVPFKIYRKKGKKNGTIKDESWREKAGIFKLFAYRRDSEYSTSDSYSEFDSNDDIRVSNEDINGDIENNIGDLNTRDISSNDIQVSQEGVRIKEVSEGRPCDNCPELCPGFIPHAWRSDD